MPKVRLQKELENIKRESEAAFQIREEFVRWDNVKTAHDLVDDMEVARMLLDCYDLIGGNFLVWSDQAKLAPPPLHATLFLQHVSEEGWEVLQEIKALGGWRQDKDKDKTEPEQRKSKRKQARVRHIEPVQVKQEVVDPEDGEDRDSQDDDYVPSGDDDDDFVPEEEDIQPKRLTKMIRKPKSRPDRGKKATKKKVAQVEAQESDDDATEDEEKDEEEETSPQPAQRKRGRPKKREVRPPPPPRKSKKKKPKPEEQETTERNGKKVHLLSTRRIFKCKVCSRICESVAEFREHFEMHVEGRVTGKIPLIASILYRCKPCNLIHKKEEVKQHRSKHRYSREKESKIAVCKLCKKTFSNSSTLSIHMKTHATELPHVCDICGKRYKTKYAVDQHRYTHSVVKPYTCEHCGKTFKDRSKLISHERTHPGGKPYQCDMCDSSFTHRTSLRTHMKSVHGDIYICGICKKRLFTRGSWSSHMSSHKAQESGKRFICEVCKKEFDIFRYLQCHLRQHTNKPLFTCEKCGKGFKTNPRLNRHMTSHDDIKPYICEQCGKGFTHPYNLNGHLRTHTGEKPFQCDICNAAFTHNVSLKTHKKSAHGIDMWKDQKPQALEVVDHMIVADPNVFIQYEVQNVSKEEDSSAQSQIKKNQIVTKESGGLQTSSREIDKAPRSSQNLSEESKESKESGGSHSYSGNLETAGSSQDLSEKSSLNLSGESRISQLPLAAELHGEPNFQSNRDVAHNQPIVNNQEPLCSYQSSYMNFMTQNTANKRNSC
ncbi:uncharacterized protein [Amphiura filiformis]|uniref:uncharacterized protein isoform X2 n=1 Tax=Amphiura filiformis TaxID=82378 RepID=UPI003B20E476